MSKRAEYIKTHYSLLPLGARVRRLEEKLGILDGQELESSAFNRDPGWRPEWGAMRNGTSFPQLTGATNVICGIAFAYKFQWFVTDGTRMMAWGFAKADAAAAAAEELNRVLLASPR